MSEQGEKTQALGPVEILSQTIAQRQEELAYLLTSFEHGMELISDMERVNELLSTSPRPDLIISEKVDMMPVESPTQLGRVNNFIPSWQAFGVRVFEDREDTSTTEIKPKCIGRRNFNDEERSQYFIMGARGGYEEHLAFAEENGLDKHLANEMLLQTHINTEAFMRMWILLPELTEYLMSKCLDEVGMRMQDKDIDEELFVAYSLMSRLVDKDDMYAVKSDGTIDTWLLCR